MALADTITRSKIVAKCGLLGAILALVSVGLAIYYLCRSSATTEFQGTFRSWATALDEPQCSKVSSDIYAQGGTVADAAVASLLCLGVVLPESLGIGGGFLALYFNKKSGKVSFLDARESAPNAASKDMFVGSAVNSETGARVIAVPGELKGYMELLRSVGSKVPQAALFQPAIKLARNGFRSGQHLTEAMRNKRELIYADEGLRKVYFNSKTNNTWQQGEIIYNHELADTLEKLANSHNFAEEFYNGPLGDRIVAKIQKSGGILEKQDLVEYEAHWQNPVHFRIKQLYNVYSADLPGSGPILAFMLNIIDAYNVTKFEETAQSYQRLTEIFKFSYAKRSLLGDARFGDVDKELRKQLESPSFAAEIKQKIKDDKTLSAEAYGGASNAPKDHGTSHACFFGPNGDVISITSTVNFYFGSGVQVGGILLNNEMNDFSTPNKRNGFNLEPSEVNFIKPKRRPMSSMVPTIVVKDGEAKLAIGGAGGSQITTASALVLFRYFYQGLSLPDAIRLERIHHQFTPNEILYEDGFNEDIIKHLQQFGHKVCKKPRNKRGSVIVGVTREGDNLVACVDHRKGGGVAGGS